MKFSTYIFFSFSFLCQTSFGMSIWQQISKEFFSGINLLNSDSETTTAAAATVKSINKAPTNKKSTKNDDANNMDDVDDDDIRTDDSSVESSTTKHYRTITLSRGLSKYGPWGYLILGMLLCGGALLVCVLWGKFFLFLLLCIVLWDFFPFNLYIAFYLKKNITASKLLFWSFIIVYCPMNSHTHTNLYKNQ